MTGVVPETAPGYPGATPYDPPERAVLAVDIGGTKLAAALVEPDGRLRGRATRPTPRGDAEAIWAALAAAIGEAMGAETITGTAGPPPTIPGAGDLTGPPPAVAGATGQAGPPAAVTGAGVGCAGPLDAVAGTVSPVNIPSWRDFPVRDRLAAMLGGRPVTLVNDAVAGAVAEYRHGAGRGSRAMLGMVVSTGVGGGLILDGRVYTGPTGNAGHIGHTVVDLAGEACPCGSRGCVETFASGTAMVRWALGNGWTHAAPDGAVLAADARAGHPIALAAFERAGRGLAAGIASAAALCDLDRVVIGGGVSRSWDVLEPPLVRAMRDYAGLAFVRRVSVVPSELGAEAGLLGAAALAHDTELV